MPQDFPLLVPTSSQGEWTAKRFYGDPKLAAAYLPVAYAMLGMVKQRMALGGVGYGAQMLELPDGTRIRVLRNGEQNIVEIGVITPVGKEKALLEVIRAFYINSISEPLAETRYAEAVILTPTEKNVVTKKSTRLDIGSLLIQGSATIFTLRGGVGGHVPVSDLAWAMGLGDGGFFSPVIYVDEFSESGYGNALYSGIARAFSLPYRVAGGRVYSDEDGNSWFLAIMLDSSFGYKTTYDQYSQYRSGWGVGRNNTPHSGIAYRFVLFNLRNPEDEGQTLYELGGTEDRPIHSPRAPWFFSDDGAQCWHYDHQAGRYFTGSIRGNPPDSISISAYKSYTEWEEPARPPGPAINPVAIIPVVDCGWVRVLYAQTNPDYNEAQYIFGEGGLIGGVPGTVTSIKEATEFHETPLGWCSQEEVYDWWDDDLWYEAGSGTPLAVIRWLTTINVNINGDWETESTTDIYAGDTYFTNVYDVRDDPTKGRYFICEATVKRKYSVNISVEYKEDSGRLGYNERTSRCRPQSVYREPVHDGYCQGQGTYQIVETLQIDCQYGNLFTGTVTKNYTINDSAQQNSSGFYQTGKNFTVTGTTTISVDFPKLLVIDKISESTLFEHRYAGSKTYSKSISGEQLIYHHGTRDSFYRFYGTTQGQQVYEYKTYTGIGTGAPPSYMKKNRLIKTTSTRTGDELDVVGRLPNFGFSFLTKTSRGYMHDNDEICRDYCFYDSFSFDVPQPLTGQGSGQTQFSRSYHAEVARDFYNGGLLVCEWEKNLSGTSVSAFSGVHRYTSNGYIIRDYDGAIFPDGDYEYVPGQSQNESDTTIKITYKFSDGTEISSVTYSVNDPFIKYIAPLYVNPKTKTAFMLEVTSSKENTDFSYQPKFMFNGSVISNVNVEIPRNSPFHTIEDYLFFNPQNNRISYAFPGFSQPNNLTLTLSERWFPEIKEMDNYFVCWTLTYLNYNPEKLGDLEGVSTMYLDGEIRNSEVNVKLLGEAKLLSETLIIEEQEIPLVTHFPVKVF